MNSVVENRIEAGTGGQDDPDPLPNIGILREAEKHENFNLKIQDFSEEKLIEIFESLTSNLGKNERLAALYSDTNSKYPVYRCGVLTTKESFIRELQSQQEIPWMRGPEFYVISTFNLNGYVEQ